MDVPSLYSALICPSCGASNLDLTKESVWQCASCSTAFPFLNEIPWLFSSPESVRTQWMSKCGSYLSYLKQKVSSLNTQLRSVDLQASTIRRLELMAKGMEHNLHQMTSLLDPLFNNKTQPDHRSSLPETPNKIPTKQGPRTYMDLLFRDWAWENNELTETIQIFDSITPPDQSSWSQLVILGGGAGRLGFELAHQHPDWSLTSVDINPLLMFVAQAMQQQKALDYFEFPISPVSLEATCALQTLRNPLGRARNLSFLFADALNLPVKRESLEAILTPWFVDIVPIDLKTLARRMNYSLRMKGEWINLGPLGFGYGLESIHYSPTEIQELLTNAGFDILEWQERSLPYLQSPHSGHWRQEKIWAFRACKMRKGKDPGKYSYLPSWLEDFDLPIPKEGYLDSVSNQSRFQFEVLTAIDGYRSINAVSQLMSAHYKMTKQMATESLIYFLTRLYEEAVQSQ